MLKHPRQLVVSSFLALVTVNQCVCKAQTSASATAVVTVEVVHGFSVTASKQLDFNPISNTGKFGAPSHASPEGSYFLVTGQPGASVTVVFPRAVAFQSPEGNRLGFKPHVPVWNTTSSRTLDRQEFPSVEGGKASFSRDGLIYVWFSGAIDTDHAARGSYAGQYIVTINY